ncbi:MAG: efflux RND transporter periplasmic adaptor subunit [Gammaproteobacteria bacterium]|nr:efflux RND transporter periplasmic adaptor subunit [Gammaproteobacteria bacterium]MBU2678429.1 efflux RND transporter periplasmic adaptor subunit [Gammaproteobacteria bacterium]NNL52164.1 efflux RND transporter periplasmic adaptor subunit [Woeseiaceae bacterium]
MNLLKIVIIAAALGVVGMPTAQAAVPFATAEVAYEVAPRERIWDGRIEAVNQATVSAQTSGRIAELPYDVNDFVDAGNVIMRFTDTEQRAAMTRAEAALEEARARYAEADQEFSRVSNMFDNQTVSRARYDQAKANRAAAQARLNAARSGVATAKEQLEYTVVRAPYAGIVAKRHVELGELVSPGQPLITGLSLQSLRVNVDVPQSMFHAVRTIGKAFVYIDDDRIAGKELTFFPVADTAANTFRVRVDLPDGSATLYPGMIVKVGFVVGETNRLLVPAQAIVRRSELSAVYVVSGDHVALRQVRLGRRYGDSIEVLAGLSAGESVATEPVSAGIYLKEESGAK